MWNEIADLKAQVQALQRERDDATAVYAEHWDPLPGDTLTDLMRAACDEAVSEHNRFKARGGEVTDLQREVAWLQGKVEQANTLLTELWACECVGWAEDFPDRLDALQGGLLPAPEGALK